MSWLLIVIIAYFLFALSSLGDKYILAGPPNPKNYTFYVGLLGGLAIVLIPFVGFSLPGPYELFLALFIGIIYLFAIYSFYYGLEHFEVSRIVPAVGGFLPIATFALIYILSNGKSVLETKDILALVLLIIGSIFITYNKKKKFPLKSLKISALASVFLAITFVLSKYLFMLVPFWTGLILIKIGALIGVLLFLVTKKMRRELFSKKTRFDKKTKTIFLVNQVAGSGGYILQSFAIAIAPLAVIPIINALQGVQYIFLFIFSLIFFKVLKEDISKSVIIQKVLAMILITIGLAIIAVF